MGPQNGLHYLHFSTLVNKSRGQIRLVTISPSPSSISPWNARLGPILAHLSSELTFCPRPLRTPLDADAARLLTKSLNAQVAPHSRLESARAATEASHRLRYKRFEGHAFTSKNVCAKSVLCRRRRDENNVSIGDIALGPQTATPSPTPDAECHKSGSHDCGSSSVFLHVLCLEKLTPYCPSARDCTCYQPAYRDTYLCETR